MIMAWLMAFDVKVKKGLKIQKYTEWGEFSTLIVFGLLVICSI